MAHVSPIASQESQMAQLGILLSGRGSNFLAIADSVAAGRIAAEIAVVISNRADILAAQSQPCARHQGARHLSAGADNLFFKWDLPGVGRKVRNHQQRVGGVQPNAHDIEFRHKRSL